MKYIIVLKLQKPIRTLKIVKPNYKFCNVKIIVYLI